MLEKRKNIKYITINEGNFTFIYNKSRVHKKIECTLLINQNHFPTIPLRISQRTKKGINVAIIIKNSAEIDFLRYCFLNDFSGKDLYFSERICILQNISNAAITALILPADIQNGTK